MAKPEWGLKRFCQNCGARFYDMRRDPPTCPKCGTPFTPRAVVRPRRGVPAAAVSKTPSPAAVEDDLAPGVEVPAFEDDAVEEVADEEFDDDADIEPLKADAEEDALLEDASELGEDDDDMSEVMDHVNDTDLADRT